MNFTKMQGTGNDFILVDGQSEDRDWSGLARAMCDRHFGVGADGLLLVLSSQAADVRMRMFNPDGSEAEACGNGIRCFAKYVIERGLAQGPELSVETLGGVRRLWVELGERGVRSVRVGMGSPYFTPDEIPVHSKDAKVDIKPVEVPLMLGGRELRVGCLSMGNPHAVCFLQEPVSDFPLSELGPQVEHHPAFPNRVNFEVVNILSKGRVGARVWERGAGETLACGTGACAIAVAARLKGYVDTPLEVSLPGGTLKVEWDGEGEVFLIGPAEMVFQGEWPD